MCLRSKIELRVGAETHTFFSLPVIPKNLKSIIYNTHLCIPITSPSILIFSINKGSKTGKLSEPFNNKLRKFSNSPKIILSIGPFLEPTSVRRNFVIVAVAEFYKQIII